jgi:hypothetical protein
MHRISIGEALPLAWDMPQCTNDWAYYSFAKLHDLIISPSGKVVTPYSEMYGLI